MKNKILVAISVMVILGMLFIPAVTAGVTHQFKGAWGLGTDTDPVGRLNGKIINNKYLIGNAYKDGIPHRIVLRLNGGNFQGYVQINHNNVYIHGEYTVTNNYITAVWHCQGHSGWIVGKLV